MSRRVDAVPEMVFPPRQFRKAGFSYPGPIELDFCPDLTRRDVRVLHRGARVEMTSQGYRVTLTAETLVCQGNA